MDKSLRPTGRPFSRSFREMYIRWGNSIRLVLKETTAACANGYAVQYAEPAVFQRRCCITSGLLPSAFSTSTMGSSEAAYILGHHQKWLHHFLGKPDQATQHRTGFCADCYTACRVRVGCAATHPTGGFQTLATQPQNCRARKQGSMRVNPACCRRCSRVAARSVCITFSSDSRFCAIAICE